MHSVKAKRKVYPDTLDIDTAGGSISKIAPQDWELPEIKIQSAVSTHFDNVNQKPSGMAARLYTHSHTSITRYALFKIDPALLLIQRQIRG